MFVYLAGSGARVWPKSNFGFPDGGTRWGDVRHRIY